MEDDEDFDDGFDDSDFLAAEKSAPKRVADSSIREGEPTSKRLKVDAIDPGLPIAKSLLSKVWGFTEFRLKQASAISSLLSGHNALVVFPTGGGKSLVYQVPALAFDEQDVACDRSPGGGLTLVVSPLIALMKDQVDALRKRGVAAAAMDSSQSREAWLETTAGIRDGTLKLLYCAPERLNNEGFVQMIRHVKIRLVAIDEAHCISEWGHAFRPDYLKVSRFVKEIQAETILCLTATATRQVASDICKAFEIREDRVFRTPTFRPNLHLKAQSFTNSADKNRALVTFFKETRGPSIVYVQTHDQTEEVGHLLRDAGHNVRQYHAGMATDARTKAQIEFMKSTNMIVVATIAFGMGIDKSDIRNVVHFSIPKSVEGYSQEIGRAGRDGLPSICMVFLCHDDISIMEEWSRADVPSLRSVKGLVGELIEAHRNSQVGDVIERNLAEESREWDIRKNALDIISARLELDFGLFRATTPKYSEYKFAKSPSFEKKTSGDSSTGATIKKLSKTAKKWTHVDVDAVARSGRFPRDETVRILQKWHDSGAIELSPSGVINRFRILKTFPKTNDEKFDIIQKIYGQIESREQSDMARVQEVISLVTTNRCIARALADHFGDSLPPEYDKRGCSHCNFCVTGKRVEYMPTKKSIKQPINEAKIRKVLQATKARDDPRFLARVAFGLTSPRVTTEKLGKHEVFGLLKDCEFEALLTRFERECE